MSFGGYIYSWPSKFQFIFWPRTDPNVLYTCKKCHYTAFMWDFEEPSKEKADAIGAVLAGVTLPAEKDYARIPMSERLYVAERVYKVIGKDEEWWCDFYRVVGYHTEAENKPQEAEAARRKALELAQQLLAREESKGARKQLLLIAGAMHHFLGEDQRAIEDLKEARGLTFSDPKLQPEQTANYNDYLSKLIDEYIARLEKGEEIPDSRPRE